MILTLRAVALNDHPLTQPISVHFDAGGGSIGRADHNTMALPDPKRHISRRQAEVMCLGGSFAITNVGSANPIVAGTRSLARGETAALSAAETLRIGGYLLEVEVDDDASAAPAQPLHGRAAAAPPSGADAALPDAPPFASFGADEALPLSPGNPFAELFAEAPVGPTDPVLDAGPVAVARRLPDDFDPFAPPAAAPPAPPRAGAPGGPFADLVPGGEPASFDRLFDLDASDGRDRLDDFLSSGRGSAAAAPVSTDPLALLFGTPDAVSLVDARPTASDHVPELHAAFAPPRLARNAETRAAVPASHDAAAADALWTAFCEGAGVKVAAPEGTGAEAMRQIGVLLRASIDGTLRLMAVRASAKHELRAPVTVIQPQRNNPLKFSPDVNAALEQLLQPPLRGFLPGAAAVEDAMDDLVGHAIGSVAGTRAALEGVLDRFAPRQLESKLAGRSVLDSVLPMNRRARLWELYLQHFEAIRGEAQDDFHSLFGRAFLAAYEQQLERLRGAEVPAPAPPGHG